MRPGIYNQEHMNLSHCAFEAWRVHRIRWGFCDFEMGPGILGIIPVCGKVIRVKSGIWITNYSLQNWMGHNYYTWPRHPLFMHPTKSVGLWYGAVFSLLSTTVTIYRIDFNFKAIIPLLCLIHDTGIGPYMCTLTRFLFSHFGHSRGLYIRISLKL